MGRAREDTALGLPLENGTKLPSGGYGVAHGIQVDGRLPDGTVPVAGTAGTSVREIVEDVTTVLDHGVPRGGAR